MLNLDTKKLTKNIKFNIRKDFREKKYLFPGHKTDHGIMCLSFKIRFRDLLRILLHRRIYVQQLTEGAKAQGLGVSIDPKGFEKALRENEKFYEEQELANIKNGSES